MRRFVFGALATALIAVPSLVIAETGDLDASFGADGVVTGGLLDEFGPVDVDEEGRTVVLGVSANSIAVARYLEDGRPDASFSGDGRADVAIPVVTRELVDIRVLDDGSIVAIGRRTTEPDQPFSNGLWAAKLTTSGAPDTGYSGDGVATLEQAYTAYAERGSINADGSAIITQIQLGGGGATSISATGAFNEVVLDFDTGAFPANCMFISGAHPSGVGWLSATDFVYAGTQNTGACTPDQTLTVTRQSIDGTVAWTRVFPVFDTDQPQHAFEIIGGDIFVETPDGIARLDGDNGELVNGWGDAGVAEPAAGFGRVGAIVDVDGYIGIVNSPLFDMSPTTLLVDRLLDDGSADPTFARYSADMGGNLTRTDIAGAPDGDLVISAQRDGEGSVRHITGTDTPDEPTIVPIAPARLLDTRPGETTVDGLFAGTGQAAATSITKVKIAGRAGIPTDATAAILNLTIVAPTEGGFATIYPCTPTRPTASSINYTPGAVIANGVTAKLDPDGNVCVYTRAATHILIDAGGYTPSDVGFGTIEPARLLDTRPGETTVDGLFAGTGQAAATSITKVKIAGRAGIPTDATAAILNLTIVAPTEGGFATIYPCTPTRPTASSINYTPGSVIANGVTAKLDPDGNVCIYTRAATHILIDAAAYVEAGATAGTITPARLLDTRVGETTVDGLFAGTGQAAATSITKVKIAGRAGIPTDATAAILNLTIVAPTEGGFATIYPCTPTRPTASSINYTPGAVIANGVTAKLDPDGNVCVYTRAATHILIDAGGYITAP